MPNGQQRIAELLSAPMEAVIIALGVGIARAQRELDRNSIETQREIDQDPTLAELGLQATWYQMPRTELELTMAISMEEQAPGAKALGQPLPTVLQPYRLKQLHIQPVNALYTNQFNYDVQASSKMKLTIVPVPPPAAETAVAPRLDRDTVIDLARPFLVTEADGKTLRADTRLSVNFSGQARLWFVLQYRMVGTETQRVALVVVDDDTRQVVKHEKVS